MFGRVFVRVAPTTALPISFNTTFAGNQVVYLATRSNTASSNWQAAGTVSVP